MGKNTGEKTRKGKVKKRVQTWNPKTKAYVKRDTETGRIMATKETPFKGVAKDNLSRKALDPAYVWNPKKGDFVKRDRRTGRFVSSKS